MPPRCIGCLTPFMPGATACPNCGRPAPSTSALTKQKDLDSTQFIRIAPGDLLPEDDLPADFDAPPPLVPRPGSGRRSLVLAVVLGLLAGAFLLLVMVALSRARH